MAWNTMSASKNFPSLYYTAAADKILMKELYTLIQ